MDCRGLLGGFCHGGDLWWVEVGLRWVGVGLRLDVVTNDGGCGGELGVLVAVVGCKIIIIINKNITKNYVETLVQQTFRSQNCSNILESNFSTHLNTSLKNTKHKPTKLAPRVFPINAFILGEYNFS